MSSFTKAATAAELIHEEILQDSAFQGYTGDEIAQARLNQELFYIASRNPSFTVEDIENEFYSNQMAIAQGLLDVDYYTL